MRVVVAGVVLLAAVVIGLLVLTRPEPQAARHSATRTVDAGAPLVESSRATGRPAPAPIVIRAVRPDGGMAGPTTSAASAPRTALVPRGAHPILQPSPIAPDDVRRGIRTVVPKIMECYQQALGEGARLSGTIVTKFKIVARGGVGRIDEAEIDPGPDRLALDSVRMEHCMLQAIASADFATGGPDGEVEVSYPFTFRLIDDADGGSGTPEDER